MKKYSWFLLVWSIILSTDSWAQINMHIDRKVRLTFPAKPEIIDTLGQKVFSFSDESGYYAIIVQQTSINAVTRANLDILKFYTEIFQSLLVPEDHCKSIKQQEVTIQDVRGMEFYTACDEKPDVPEIRYKRILLFESKLYVLDFWTTQAFFSQATTNKNAFFESMTIQTSDDKAFIPPAVESTSYNPKDLTSYLWLILILLGLPLIYFFVIKKPKK